MICHGKYTFQQMQSVFVCLFQCWSVCAVLVYYVLWSSSSLMSISLLVDLRFVGLKAIRWIYITHRSYAYHSNTHTHTLYARINSFYWISILPSPSSVRIVIVSVYMRLRLCCVCSASIAATKINQTMPNNTQTERHLVDDFMIETTA